MIRLPAANNKITKTIRMILIRIVSAVIATVIIIAILHIIYPSDAFHLTIPGFLYLTAFLLGWALVISGLCYFLISLGLNKNAAYVISVILILIANTAIFYVNPFINAVQSDIVLRQWLIKFTVHINPMLTIASNFFKYDILRSNLMYSICDIGPYYFYGYANWINVLLYYILLSVFAFGLAIISNRLIFGKTIINQNSHNEKN
jgi:hypothetical protein